MIFITIGNYSPFDRMVRVIDKWAALRGRTDIFAQIGSTNWRPEHIKWTDFLKPEEFDRKMQEANVVIAHAGAGTILKALELGKPILVMPRRPHLHETPNNHQLFMAKRFQDLGRIAMAQDESDLMAKLDHLEALRGAERISPVASRSLLEAIRDFMKQ
ncbi:MAG: glycosyltransferase [Candidatus Omnitrophica bacterium]|jgi:UDP-N-acetylglucosamine transferase subunit ALG13|nr:glycosyltransferase [Candidatus Omnitrophota bacterium]